MSHFWSMFFFFTNDLYMKTSFCPNKLVLNETKLIQKLWPIEPTKPETLRRFLIQVLTTNFTQLFRLRAKWWKGSGNRLRVEFLFGYSASKPNLLGVIFWIFWRGILCSLWYTYCKTKKRVSCMSPFYFLKLLSLFFKQLTYHKSLQCNLLKTNWLRRTVRGTQLFRLHAGWWKGSGNRLKVE